MNVPPTSSTLAVDTETGALEWRDVYTQHASDVARWAARLAGPSEDVEDLVHEVFLVVQDKLPSFRGDARLTTWLYRITVNVVRHQRRKNRLRRWLGAAPIAEPVDPGPAPDETAAARQSLRRVYRALERLSDKDRRVLVLCELEGLSGAEVAQLEGVSANAIWVRLHRARARFAKAVAALENTR